MTAFAIDYRADRVVVAADSLAYEGDKPVGFISKILMIPHLRALLLSRGYVEIAAWTVASLLLKPAVFSLEAAADALPETLNDVTAQLCAESGIPDTGDQHISEICLIGWSEAEGRMRSWHYLSQESYSRHDEWDAAYGGPYCWPALPPGYLPLDRASVPLDEKLLGVIHAIDRWCIDNSVQIGGRRLGGDIVAFQVMEGGAITQRVIGQLPDHDQTLAFSKQGTKGAKR
jgi:hypothetical protein